MGDVAILQFVHFNLEHIFIPYANPHCILSQIYALFIEFYYFLFLFSLKILIIIQWYVVSSVFWKKNDVQCFSLPEYVGPLWGNRCTY